MNSLFYAPTERQNYSHYSQELTICYSRVTISTFDFHYDSLTMVILSQVFI